MIPNHHTALDAGGTLCLHRIPCCPDVSERGRWSHARGLSPNSLVGLEGHSVSPAARLNSIVEPHR